MLGGYKKLFILSLFFMLIIFAGSAPAKLTNNPHNKMDCGNCHKGVVTFGKPIDKLELTEDNIVTLCLKCHSEIMNVHHPQRVQVTEEVPDYLPVGEGNSITCRTCHDVHIEDVSMHLIRSSSIGNYTSRIDICYECHIENFKKISPHKSEKEGLSCLTCHRDSPTIKDTSATVTLVTENIEKMCNFCHVIDVDNHPLNVDKTIKLSDVLPLSKDKKVICITCHDPHGAINTINFLREKYVTDVEFGKYENPHSVREYYSCLKCHTSVSGVDIDEYIDCKYKNDYILLCYNCHGADAEKCHFVNIALEEGMTLPEGFELNDDGLISCVTCHNPDCTGHEKIRYRNLSKLKTSSCSDCHEFSSLKSVNPHLGKEETTTCFYCHKKGQKIEDFGLSQKFVCLRCHKYKLHPSNVDHLVKPRMMMVMIEEIKLDGKGKIKCSTCHNPHSTDRMSGKLKSFENIAICEACHQI